MTRHAWDDLASDLSNAGIHVLAFDYRGYGDSTGTLPPAPPTPPPAAGTNRKFSPTTSGGWVANRDVELAFGYLRAQRGVDVRHLAVGGASCGAEFAADLASRHPEIRALLLMSGRISGGAAAHIAAASWLSVFGAAAQEDMPIAYEGLQQAIATSKNPNSMMKMFPGRQHGVEMFATAPGLRPLIVEWLQAQLR
jgi:pimeloyl-ACP methyl ester carboxylesterase